MLTLRPPSCLLRVAVSVSALAVLVFCGLCVDLAIPTHSDLSTNASACDISSKKTLLRRIGLPRPSVALGIQTDILMLGRWRSLLSALSTEERERFAVFLYVYGEGDIEGALNEFRHSDVAGLLAAASTPASRIAASQNLRESSTGSTGTPAIAVRDTWTSGRNSLARLMYTDEITRGAQYSWWALADADMSRLKCMGCGVADQSNSTAVSACCFLHAFIAAESFPFASVATTPFAQDPPKPVQWLFHVSGRVDAQFQVRIWAWWTSPLLFFSMRPAAQIFHRRAVPVLLPYHDDLDRVSWFASQELVQLYSRLCLPGAVVGLALTVRSADNQHASYPRHGYSGENVTSVLRKHHPAIAGRFLDNSGTGVCAPPSTPAPAPPFGSYPIWYPERVVRWQDSSEFACCLSERGPNFITLVGGGVPEAPR